MTTVEFARKGIQFIYRYITHDPLFVFQYALAYFQKGYTNDAKFYSDQELASCLQSGKSVIRIGDGEIGLLHGRDISYQKADKGLVEYLRKSIAEYTSESPYILAIPVFVNQTNTELIKKNVLRCWLPLKIEYRRSFKKEVAYADAHFFYYKNKFETYLEEYLENKKLIINTTQENINRQKSAIEKQFTVLGWVEAKSPEPFDLFNETQKQIDEIVKRYDGDMKDVALVLSSGPMSKALAYIYAKKGIQAFDIGKGFEHIYNSNNFESNI